MPEPKDDHLEDELEDDDEITPEDRADWAFRGLVNYLAARVGGPFHESEEEVQADPGTALTDLLADLRHYCDRTGLSFAEYDRKAYQYYLHELEAFRRPYPSARP